MNDLTGILQVLDTASFVECCVIDKNSSILVTVSGDDGRYHKSQNKNH